MIEVNKINGDKIVINADLIESVQTTPDTIITLTNNKKILVEENVEEIIEKVILYRRKVFSHLQVIEE
ncbi:MAG: flagellar FlbD family protein [Halanaerobiales bacterium]